jgi:hypothetical protein
VYGTAFDRCIFNTDEFSRRIFNTSNRTALPSRFRLLSNDIIIMVWHVRVGDIVPHEPTDPFYERALDVLKEITQGYKLYLLLIGKGKRNNDNAHSVRQDYLDSVSTSVDRLWKGSTNHLPKVAAPNLSFHDAFLAMMQADVLIGSGSSLPAIANLVSGEPLFFNHVMNNGCMYGSEMLEDSVDMESNGAVIDSHRRLKVAIHERMRNGYRRACPFAEIARYTHNASALNV